jgi:hypothetical protein
VEIYLIIDNATESDAGTYDVQATTQYIGLPITDMEQVNIIVGAYVTPPQNYIVVCASSQMSSSRV